MTASSQFLRLAAAALPVSSLGFEVAPNHMARFVLSNSNGIPDIGVSCGNTGQIARSAHDLCSVLRIARLDALTLKTAHDQLSALEKPLSWPQALWVMDKIEDTIWQRERHARQLFQVSRPTSLFNQMLSQIPPSLRNEEGMQSDMGVLAHTRYASVIINQLAAPIAQRLPQRHSASAAQRI